MPEICGGGRRKSGSSSESFFPTHPAFLSREEVWTALQVISPSINLTAIRAGESYRASRRLPPASPGAIECLARISQLELADIMGARIGDSAGWSTGGPAPPT